jgi:hypothetical protein
LWKRYAAAADCSRAAQASVDESDHPAEALLGFGGLAADVCKATVCADGHLALSIAHCPAVSAESARRIGVYRASRGIQGGPAFSAA